MKTITEAEILKALHDASRQTERPDGFSTIAELVQATGWPDSKVRRAMSAAKAQGRLLVKRAMRETLSGTLHPVPVYRITPPVAKGKARR